MEIVFTGMTKDPQGEIIDLEVQLKPISIEDSIILKYLEKHPIKMKTPIPIKKKDGKMFRRGKS
ncbi:hypothetical protein LCGC14_0861510 [marine sediment metagenome]|uniref:Uncharacterized protein n=1 Tax=marine sediment metagenome TaxID=412755 RepID=A0A0F9PSP9_9ZZZZ